MKKALLFITIALVILVGLCKFTTLPSATATPAPRKGTVVGVLQANALYRSGPRAGTISVSYWLLESGEVIRTEPASEVIRPYIDYPYTNEEAKIIILATKGQKVAIHY